MPDDDTDLLVAVLTAHQGLPRGRFQQRSHVECRCEWIGKTEDAHIEHVAAMLWARLEEEKAEPILNWANAHCIWSVPEDDDLSDHTFALRSNQCACGWSDGDPRVG